MLFKVQFGDQFYEAEAVDETVAVAAVRAQHEIDERLNPIVTKVDPNACVVTGPFPVAAELAPENVPIQAPDPVDPVPKGKDDKK